MPGTLQSEVMHTLGGPGIRQIAGALGTDPALAEETVQDALPALVGGLAHSTESPQGAKELYDTLGRFSGTEPLSGVSILAADEVGGEILTKVLGNRLDPATAAISRRTGIPVEQIRQALVILAPIVMAVLAKRVLRSGQSAQDVARDLQAELPKGDLGSVFASGG